jgi:hypothetical protein
MKTFCPGHDKRGGKRRKFNNRWKMAMEREKRKASISRALKKRGPDGMRMTTLRC